MKKILILDFDGTIIDSNYVKQIALVNFISEKYSVDILKKINSFELQKLTRYELISLAKDSYILNYEKEIIDDYINNQVIKSNIDPSIFKVFKYCSKKKIKIFLVSNTPNKSLENIVNNLNIRHYFNKVIGKKEGKDKSTIFSEICLDEGVKSKEILSVGDNLDDYFASKINNIPFHGIYNHTLLTLKGKIPISYSLEGIFKSLK